MAGCEDSEKISNFGSEMFGNDNMYLREMVEELVLHGRSGFVSRKNVSIYKRISPLNREVSSFLCNTECTQAIRFLLCATGD